MQEKREMQEEQGGKKAGEGKASGDGSLTLGKWRIPKKLLIPLLAVLLGLVILLLGGMGNRETASDYALSAETYRKELEAEMAKLCAKVTGAGKVSLRLVLEMGEEYVYAKDLSQSGAYDYVHSGKEGLLLYRKCPKVAGVAVVCEGGASPSVRTELTLLLHGALGVPLSRITISPGR